MNSKLKVPAIGIILVLMLSGFGVTQSPPEQKTHTLEIIKINNVWKVVNTADSSYVVKVKLNDKIEWTTVGTNALFEFHNDLFDSTAVNYSKYIKDGKKLNLKIKSNAKKGTYIYSVFCTPDSVYAIGGSPPKIIVE